MEKEEKLKKAKGKLDISLNVHDLAGRALHFIEERDRIALFMFFDANAHFALVDFVDSRGYTLLHMACFKNYFEIGEAIVERAKQEVTDEKF